MGGRPDALVDVRLSTQGEVHRITIADTGPGIPADLREQVFRPFFTTKPAPHNGVGLYLAREIIRSFGGSVHLATPPSGVGTEVIVSLPRKALRNDVVGRPPEKARVPNT